MKFLVLQYELGIALKGIIYMHRITDNKMQGTARRYFEMFKRLCGDKSLANVVLLTTMWDHLKDHGLGLRRDQQLREEFWNIMEAKGSHIRSYDGSKEMAEAIVCRLMRKPDTVLDIQRELVDEGRRLEETAAGKLIVPDIDNRMTEASLRVEALDRSLLEYTNGLGLAARREIERERATVLAQRDTDMQRRERLKARLGKEAAAKIEGKTRSQKWKDRVSIFASILGLTISMTVNLILPLAGVTAI